MAVCSRPSIRTCAPRPWRSGKNRIPWLLLLMISATLTGLVISHFETALGVLPLP